MKNRAKKRKPEPAGDEADHILSRFQSMLLGSTSAPFSDRVLALSYEPVNVGEMARPDGIGFVRGSCGDSMTVYVREEAGRLGEVTFLTDGCSATIACGCAVTELARGRTPFEASRIHPQEIIRYLDGLPPDHLHCAGLAVQALQKALGDLNAPANREEAS